MNYTETYKDYIVRYSYTGEENEISYEVEKDGEIIDEGWTVLRPGYNSVAEYVITWCL